MDKDVDVYYVCIGDLVVNQCIAYYLSLLDIYYNIHAHCKIRTSVSWYDPPCVRNTLNSINNVVSDMKQDSLNKVFECSNTKHVHVSTHIVI